MLTIGTTVLGVNDVARATAFWCDALGYVPRDDGDETWVVLDPGLSIEIGDRTVDARPGDEFVIHAEQAHRIRCAGSTAATPCAGSPDFISARASSREKLAAKRARPLTAASSTSGL